MLFRSGCFRKQFVAFVVRDSLTLVSAVDDREIRHAQTLFQLESSERTELFR